MSVDQRLREAFGPEPSPAPDRVAALVAVRASARRQDRRTRGALVLAVAAVVAVIVTAGTLLYGGHSNRSGDIVDTPTPTPTTLVSPSVTDIDYLEHHQGRWVTRSLTRADFAQTLTDLGKSEWSDALTALLPEYYSDRAVLEEQSGACILQENAHLLVNHNDLFAASTQNLDSEDEEF